jgi:hypothetical protein
MINKNLVIYSYILKIVFTNNKELLIGYKEQTIDKTKYGLFKLKEVKEYDNSIYYSV